MSTIAEGTQRAYRSDWVRFQNWCRRHDRNPLPTDGGTVVDYLKTADQYAPATLGRWVSAINHRHVESGFPTPGPDGTVRRTLASIRSARPTRAVPRHAITPGEVAELVTAARRHGDRHGWGQQILARRDTALLLLGFTAALGSGSLSALQTDDLGSTSAGVDVRMTGADQDRTLHLTRGEQVRTCAPCALANWRALLDAGDRSSALVVLHRPIGDGHTCAGPSPSSENHPLFPVVTRDGRVGDQAMTGDAITDRIRTRARQAGWDTTRIATLGGGSLRRGRVATGLRLGESLADLQHLTGHRSLRYLAQYTDVDRPPIRLGL